MPSLQVVARLWTLKWSEMLQYRLDITAWTVANTMVPLVALAVWYTVAASSPQGPPARDVLTYYVVVMFIRFAASAWVGYFLSQEILRGTLVTFLVRPLSVFWYHAVESLTVKLFRLVPTLIVLAVVVGLFPHWFSPSLYDGRRVALFAASLLLAAALTFAFDALLAMVAFWIEDAIQLFGFEQLLYEVASGMLIPFVFMPPLLERVFTFLPFRSMVATPAEILIGQATGDLAMTLVAQQAAWLVVTVALATWVWRRGLRVYAIPGQ